VNKKLAIVGAEPRTRDNAPYDNPDYDIWAISNWANAPWMKRCTAVIEIHKPSLYMNHPLDPGYWEFLQATDTPVYMQTADDRISNAVVYPLEDVLDVLADLGNLKINGRDPQTLNSSIVYAIGLAILQGYEVINIYGVEMANSSEYRSQQPMFTFWVGFAAGRGIDLNINCTEGLFIQPLYGYEDMMNTEKLHKLMDGMKQQLEDKTKEKHMIEGALMLARQLLDQERN
jgi:hypothetical protein